MEIEDLKFLLNNLVKDIESLGHHILTYDKSLIHRYYDLICLCEQPLFDNSGFLGNSKQLTNRGDILSALQYIETLLNLIGKREKIELEGTFMNPSRQMLEQAGIAFKNNDFQGVSNKLNTCIELALKEILDIPTTIKGINVSKIIDIMISEKVGSTRYLEEVKKHVILDNLVKHQGLVIVEARAGNAISSAENLLNKLPDKPFELSEEVNNKIWSGVN